jgi:excisionase family DNA binding protein
MPEQARRAQDEEATQALFVRIPAEHARRLDRAAFELKKPKQALVSELLERYVDPDSSASLAALARARAPAHTSARTQSSAHAEAGRRRVVVETLDDSLVVGHHSFQPHEPAAHAEVLTSEQAAELLQLDVATVEGLASSGELPGRKLAGRWRFSRAALVEWLSHPQAEAAGGARERDR